MVSNCWVAGVSVNWFGETLTSIPSGVCARTRQVIRPVPGRPCTSRCTEQLPEQASWLTEARFTRRMPPSMSFTPSRFWSVQYRTGMIGPPSRQARLLSGG